MTYPNLTIEIRNNRTLLVTHTRKLTTAERRQQRQRGNESNLLQEWVTIKFTSKPPEVTIRREYLT